jgi:hypothetical protein
MITKIVPGDVFSTDLQPGESPDQPIDIIVGTNQAWQNTRGVWNQIGRRFNAEFLNLLEWSRETEVPLGHVFSREGLVGAQPANFHAIAVNHRPVPGGPQDWSELHENLTTWLDFLHANENMYESDIVDDPNFHDVGLRDAIALIPLREWADYAAEVAHLVNEHIERTRRKFRVVLIGGADGQKNGADLRQTLEALEKSPLILHLYLGHEAAVLRAVQKVIPFIPELRARELIASDAA